MQRTSHYLWEPLTMNWTTPGVLETITGTHIALWLIAYAAWRFLTTPHRARRAGVVRATTAAVAVPACRPASPAVRCWARRAAMLDRLHDERALRHVTRRRLQRAA